MALLDAANRLKVGDHSMRQVGAALASLTKPDLRAAVDATDQWIDDNTASFNAALPLNFRTIADLQNKTLLFCWVAMRRAGILQTEGD